LERALAEEDARLLAREVAAGEAVVAAMGGVLAEEGIAYRESELVRLTGFSVAEVRRWARMAREAEQGVGTEAAVVGGGPDRGKGTLSPSHDGPQWAPGEDGAGAGSPEGGDFGAVPA
jgi:hypothetical protein